MRIVRAVDARGRAQRDGLPIQQVSTLLGVPAPTLRSWELRYGVPVTVRSAGGHRRYSAEDVRQLRLMRDEVALGRRAADAAAAVRALLVPSTHQGRIAELLSGSDAMRPEVVRGVLDGAREDLGLGTTLDEVLLPAMRQVGSWWASGRCDEAQEHLTTETVRGWISGITAFAPAPRSTAPVLLACGPRDLHSLGLEALGALLAEQQVGYRLLGARTPARTLAAAVPATGASAVVLVSHLPTQRRPAVDSLRAVEPSGVPLYYAGNAFLFPAARRDVPGSYLGERLTVAAGTIRDAVLGATEPSGESRPS